MKKFSEQSAILHDAYFNKPPCLIRLFLVRLVLLCGLSSSAIWAISDLYCYDGDKLFICLIPAIVAAVVYILATVVPSWIVYIFSFMLYCIAFIREDVREKLTFFCDYFILRINSRLLKTEDYVIHNLVDLKSGYYRNELIEGTEFGFVMLGILLAILFVASSRARFRPLYAMLLFVLFAAPSFAAEIAGYHNSIAVFAAFYFAFYAVRMAYELDGLFVFEKYCAAGDATRRNEKSYRRRMFFAAFGRKLRGDIPRYLKYSGNSIIAIIVTASVMMTTAYVIPDGTTFDYEQIFTEIKDAGYFAAEKVEEVFDKSFDVSASKARNDYFSYSQYGDNSGGIGITNPSDSDRPVLDVILQENDIPVYLKGDIGVNFSSSGWTAIRDEYENIGGWDEIADFYPESQYQITRQKLSRYGYEPDDFLPLRQVSVTYRRKTNVVFQPLAPYELDYRESEYFDSFGDTIYRTKSYGGGLNTYESLALTPNMNCGELSAFLGNPDMALNSGEWNVPGGISSESYEQYVSDYETYIENAYKTVEKGIVDGLINDLKNGGYISDYMTRYNVAQGICGYFKENFTYSLTVDNGSGEDILDNFLYETKEGHCALFATATVLALRTMNIPARYVTGYVVSGNGTETPDGYSYTLREKDLHAWVEVYFKGIGWLPFDPTASVSGFSNGEETEYTREEFEATQTTVTYPVTGPDGETMTTTAVVNTDTAETNRDTSYDGGTTTLMPDSTSGGEAGVTPAPKEENKLIPIIITALVVIVAIGAVVAAVYLLVKRVENAEKQTFGTFRKKNSNRAVADMYKLVLIILSKQGLTPECEMMTDFAVRVDASIFLKGANVFMVDVMPVFVKTEFGDPEISPVTEEERASVYKFTLAVYKKYINEKSKFGRFITKISLFL